MTRAWGRADPADYRELAVRAHALLADVPLHDVWQVELPGGGPDLTLADVHPLVSAGRLTSVNAAVRGLFRLRSALGRLFGWDAPESGSAPDPRSYASRVPTADVERSQVAPGSKNGAFTVLYLLDSEAVSEIINSTVHAFSVFALEPYAEGQRLFWAIHVAPVGRITGCYMRLIDPFRRWLVYPAILRHVHRAWLARRAQGAEYGRG